MAAPTLVIGVGGTGIRVLLRVKERLLEAYDEVPEDVILYELDTDDYRDNRESFNGVELLVENEGENVGRERAEFYHVATANINMTLDGVFNLKNKGDREWQWVNVDRLGRTLTAPETRVISAGARTVRPVGRSALFMDYSAVYSQLRSRLMQVAGKQRSRVENDRSDGVAAGDERATVFVVASVAGGSGAGMVIDILRMLEDMRNQTELIASYLSVMVALVGGASFTRKDGERTESNTLAALRELDRLGAVAGRALNRAVPPVMFAPSPVRRFASNFGPADMIFLFDRPDRLGTERGVDTRIPNAFLESVVTPSIADMIMAFTDEKIAPAMRTIRADQDQKWRRRDPLTGELGYFPYASAGIHTLIFPERDVRKSAGLRLLLELWDEHLVRPKDSVSDYNDDLAPATTELWGEERAASAERLTPQVFTDLGFQRGNVCSGAANNNFIQMVVSSAVNRELQLPRSGGWWPWSRRSMIARVLNLIGLPNSAAQGVDVQRIVEQLENRIDRSIEELEGARNVQDVRNWRLRYLGDGQLGSETGGAWVRWMHEAESIRGHSTDFKDVLQKVVSAILNDADPQDRRLPHRLEYAECVLKRLKDHILRLTVGDPDDRSQGSLFSDYFSQQTVDEERPRAKVNDLESRAARGERFQQYVAANKDYAKAKKELVGKELLRLLCDDLSGELNTLQANLNAWNDLLHGARRKIAEEQNMHERNRKEKAHIPVRTYVTDRPEGGDYKDGEFERALYNRHRTQAINDFLTAVEWKWIGKQFELSAPFGFVTDPKAKHDRLKDREVDETKLAQRAVTWACTKKGNPDHRTNNGPLRSLASPDEVNMAVRIRDYFSPDGTMTLSNRLTRASYLATLCPLSHWPQNRLMYGLALPHTAPDEDDVRRFYDAAEKSILGATAPPSYDERRPIIFDPENPRHAVALEFAVGFNLEHRSDYESYIETYRRDTREWFALHCLPEEDIASTYYELEFNNGSRIYQGLNLRPMLLDPAAVDVLGDKGRLQMFVTGLAAKAIDQLPAARRPTEGADYYLWPQATNAHERLRLSKMHTPDEIRSIAQDLTKDASRLGEMIQDQLLVNRLRLIYAVRTFVLLEYDVDDGRRPIQYEDVRQRVEKQINRIPLEQRISVYRQWHQYFLQFYVQYGEKHPMLGHMGLVLGRVAYDLCQAEESKLHPEERETPDNV